MRKLRTSATQVVPSVSSTYITARKLARVAEWGRGCGLTVGGVGHQGKSGDPDLPTGP